ncbi:hypothetical protein PWY87_08640 [Kribbella solani]|uniref:hypothetical protein n=1 Tax=Kribbella solani TaxID=236067 RepID=UPI0029A223E7|nr:hypothetical protein [Kribbella solani]MDX3001730.1 hypothetical protein [Kribbella solani]
MRLSWGWHSACVADVVAYCVHPGCRRQATHCRPLGISDDGELIEELICCRHLKSHGW